MFCCTFSLPFHFSTPLRSITRLNRSDANPTPFMSPLLTPTLCVIQRWDTHYYSQGKPPFRFPPFHRIPTINPTFSLVPSFFSIVLTGGGTSILCSSPPPPRGQLILGGDVFCAPFTRLTLGSRWLCSIEKQTPISSNRLVCH